MRGKRKTEKQESCLVLGAQSVPVLMVREIRNSCRASVGKEGLIFRQPKGLNALQEQQAWNWFVRWAEDLHQKKPAVFQSFALKEYRSGDFVQVGQKRYQLFLEPEKRTTSSAKLFPGNTIVLQLNDALNGQERQKTIKTLLSRVIAKDALPGIQKRVAELNALHFRQPIRQIRLSYQHSKWGSCSSLGNVNLSTRLLFAPDAVIDYVIIHELAHLLEMNHSSRFWELVRQAMPDYKLHEKWLREHGALCDF